MYGIAVLFFIFIYLLISYGVIALVIKIAGKLGWSRKVWGILGL